MANLFNDGFESGNLSAWSGAATNGGNLSVTTGAAIHGSYGAAFLINDTNSINLEDETPNAETRYRFRFYLDVNSLTMGDGNEFALMYGFSEDWSMTPFYLKLRKNSGNYQLAFGDYTDGVYSAFLGWYTITDAPHCIECDWKKSSAPGANNGSIQVWVDGVLQGSSTSVDNDTESIGRILLGAPGELDSGTSGTFYIDDFASNNDGSEIGLMSAGTNIKINISDAWKDVSEMKINIGDSWKEVTKAQINIGDSWKNIFG